VLRVSLLLFAGALALTGLILLIRGLPGGAQALGLGGVIVLGTVFERWRYRPDSAGPEARWQPTGERFQDPQTGQTVQVFYDPRSGERRYVTDPEPPRT
jgi:hypothetical protein